MKLCVPYQVNCIIAQMFEQKTKETGRDFFLMQTKKITMVKIDLGAGGGLVNIYCLNLISISIEI